MTDDKFSGWKSQMDAKIEGVRRRDEEQKQARQRAQEAEDHNLQLWIALKQAVSDYAVSADQALEGRVSVKFVDDERAESFVVLAKGTARGGGTTQAELEAVRHGRDVVHVGKSGQRRKLAARDFVLGVTSNDALTDLVDWAIGEVVKA